MTDLSDYERWIALRKKALKPLYLSETKTTPQDREEFLAGAELLRFYGEKAMPGRTPHPQQLLMVDVLAAGMSRNAVLFPRRSAKTTSAVAIGLGRAQRREDYRVAILTLTTGKAGRSRFLKDVAPALERLGGPEKSTWPFKVIKSSGQERVEFKASGGSMSWLSSIEDLRGEAFDLIILDEAGEPGVEKVLDAISAALPTLDTRPGAQILVCGTAGDYRQGNLLWDWLTLGRDGKAGIIEYAAPDTSTEEELAGWEPTEEHPLANVKNLVLASHPGVGTLTTLATIQGNYETLGPERFTREYLGIFGTTGTNATRLLDAEKWEAAGIQGTLPAPPARFALAFAAHHEQQCASVVAAWRTDDGKAHVVVLDHKPKVSWAGDVLYGLWKKYKMPIAYDFGSGAARVETEKLEQSQPRPKLRPFTFPDMKVATALLVDELNEGRLVHYHQPTLDNSANIAVKRNAGNAGGWLLGRVLAEDDITGLEAGAMALRLFDTMGQQSSYVGKVVT